MLKCKTYTYHYDCFTCDMCNKRFMPGDEYQFNENLLLCKNDLANICRKSITNEDSYGSSIESPPSCTRSTSQQATHSLVDMTTSCSGNYKAELDYSMEHEGRLYIDEYGCGYMKGKCLGSRGHWVLFGACHLTTCFAISHLNDKHACRLGYTHTHTRTHAYFCCCWGWCRSNCIVHTA